LSKEIPIGTAAPNPEQLALVKHHFVGQLSVRDDYNVYRFEQDVLKLLEKGFRSKDVFVMAGGSGLYIDAVCDGIDELPDPDPELRSNLRKLFDEHGIVALQEKLKTLDSEYFEVVDRNNSKRLMRAIEVCVQTGKPYSQQRLNKGKERPFNILKVGMDVPRDMLNQRINKRTDQMLAEGWLKEAKSLLPLRNFNALNTVGYKELFSYFDGERTLEKAIEKIKTSTRRYAKRQMTWFRKDKDIHWFNPADVAEIIRFSNACHFEGNDRRE